MKDQVLIRAKDVGLLILVVTVLGYLSTVYRRTYMWDDAYSKTINLETKQATQETDLAVIKAQLALIIRKLDQMN